MSKPTAVIIGAGIGGLATAIQLAIKGIDVSIFEKNNNPGGRCQRIIKNGHTFDTGPTMCLLSNIYSAFFSSIGENIDNYIKLLRCEPSYLLNFPDNSSLILSSNKQMMKSQFEAIEPGSYNELNRFLSRSKDHYDFGLEKITLKNLRYPWDFFNLENLYLSLKLNALSSHHQYVGKFFKDYRLKAAFTFQDSYLGLEPFKAPAIFSLISYGEYMDGNYLIEGGMFGIVKALERIAKKHKVKIIYGKPVKKIVTMNNRATNIVFEDNTEKSANYIIVNADLSYTYRKLLENDSYNKQLGRKKYSCSVIAFHWGVSKNYPLLKTHNLFFSKDYKESFDQVVYKTDPPDEPHFYIQAPSRTDIKRAPEGHDTLSVMVPINHIRKKKPVDWEKYIPKLRQYIFERLDRAGIKDIKEHIKFEIIHSPKDWQNYFNLTNGSVYGLHHNLSQLGYFRPRRIHSKYKNLFFVGSSNHPGSGIPSVLLSSQFTSQEVLNRIGDNP